MTDSRIEMAEERFRTLLLKWLADLPADGWEGTSHDLGDELSAFDNVSEVAQIDLRCWRRS